MNGERERQASSLTTARTALDGVGVSLEEAAAAVRAVVGEAAASPRFAGSARHLSALSSALDGGDRAKALRHLEKLERGIRPVANDRPHGVGDRVAVSRHRHGWEDGRLEATVTRRSANADGTWSYLALDDDGAEIEIGHTRDARPVR